eukprot:1000188-Rhodomonas_salina.1
MAGEEDVSWLRCVVCTMVFFLCFCVTEDDDDDDDANDDDDGNDDEDDDDYHVGDDAWSRAGPPQRMVPALRDALY